MCFKLLEVGVDELFAAIRTDRHWLGRFDRQTVGFDRSTRARRLCFLMFALDLHLLGDRHGGGLPEGVLWVLVRVRDRRE